MRCCYGGCKRKAVEKGLCDGHAGKDTRLCLKCRKWFVKKSKYDGLCDGCEKHNDSMRGKTEHRAIF